MGDGKRRRTESDASMTSLTSAASSASIQLESEPSTPRSVSPTASITGLAILTPEPSEIVAVELHAPAETSSAAPEPTQSGDK